MGDAAGREKGNVQGHIPTNHMTDTNNDRYRSFLSCSQYPFFTLVHILYNPLPPLLLFSPPQITATRTKGLPRRQDSSSTLKTSILLRKWARERERKRKREKEMDKKKE